MCLPCEPGFSQPLGAALECKPCAAGEYQDAFGSISCPRCALSSYQDRAGQSACLQCPAGTTTLGLGSVALGDCRCDENTINTAEGSLLIACVACGEGLNCPYASDLQSLKTGTSDLGSKFVPSIKEGYYSPADDVMKIYKCGVPDHCPGGMPGQCQGGRVGIPCAGCPEGKTWAGEQCVDCHPGTIVLWLLALLALALGCALSYYFTKPRGPKLNARQTSAVAGGIAFRCLQTVAILGMMTVEWPKSFGSASGSLQILILDLDGLSFSCVASSSTWFRYLLMTASLPALCIWMRLCLSISQWLPRRALRWNKDRMLNALGNLLQVSYGTMSAVALQPLMCYTCLCLAWPYW